MLLREEMHSEVSTGVFVSRARLNASLASPFDCDTYDYFEF
jgi:hypothetical protein